MGSEFWWHLWDEEEKELRMFNMINKWDDPIKGIKKLTLHKSKRKKKKKLILDKKISLFFSCKNNHFFQNMSINNKNIKRYLYQN